MSVIAAKGLRGLTHRAVDEAAGLPPGSTSYHARTRFQLIELTLRQMAEDDEQTLLPTFQSSTAEAEAVVELMVDFIHTAVTRDRERTLARFELALEANRTPELREIYNRFGSGFRRMAESVLRDLGSPAPWRHARVLIAWGEGTIFDSVAGIGSMNPPGRTELRVGAHEVLRSVLDGVD